MTLCFLHNSLAEISKLVVFQDLNPHFFMFPEGYVSHSNQKEATLFLSMAHHLKNASH